MITDPLFYLITIPALIITGISKGGFGSGLGSIAVPLMALCVPVPQATAIMLPILIAMDWIGIWRFRRDWDRPNMAIIMAGGTLGVVVGYLTFKHLPEHLIRLMIGLIAVGFVANAWRRRNFAAIPAPRSWPRGAFWSSLSGLTSFVANAGGPPLGVYLLPLRLPRTQFVATTVVFFTAINLLKVPPFLALGQFTRTTLMTALVLMPLAPIGMALGIWLHGRLDDRVFYRLCNWFLLLTGLKLVWDGLSRALGA